MVLTDDIPLGKLPDMQKLIDFLAAQPPGYKAALARHIGRAPSYFSRQLAGDRVFSVPDCIAIEKYTCGQVRCEDVLPEIDWQFLRTSSGSAAA